LEPRRQIPEPTYHWPGGPTADDDPTPIESALAALKIGAILAAAITIAFIYLGTYAGIVAGRMESTVIVLAAFVLPSAIAAWRTAWVRRRRGSR
jgi:small-conductance mechanosensitive channel